MEVENKRSVGYTNLTTVELMYINGGDTPSSKTSFANDLAYYTVYSARAIWDGWGAFIDGARSTVGQGYPPR